MFFYLPFTRRVLFSYRRRSQVFSQELSSSPTTAGARLAHNVGRQALARIPPGPAVQFAAEH